MSDEFNPFSGGDFMGGNASSKVRTPSLPSQKKVASESKNTDKEETSAEYCKRVLKEHNYMESNIAVNDPYWRRKQE